MNTVHNILNTNFSNLPLEDKLKIKELGRPLPNLKLTQISERKAENRSFTRHFQETFIQEIIGFVVVTFRIYCTVSRVYYFTMPDQGWTEIGQEQG